MAEWLRNGLQNRVHQFNSGRGLHHKLLIFQLKFEFCSSSTNRAESARTVPATGFARGLLETLDSGPMA